MNEKHVDMAIRQVLGQDTSGKGRSCPDHNLLAAYLEDRLEKAEKDAFEDHAGECASCRHLLAMAMTIGDEPAEAAPLPSPKPKKLLFHVSIPVSAFVLIVVAVAAGVLFLRTSKQPGGAPPEIQIAELRAPAPKPSTEQATIPRDVSAASQPQERRPLAAKNQAGPTRPTRDRKGIVPAAKTPQIPSSSISPLADAGEVAEFRAKTEAQPQAAGVEYAPVRTENVSQDQLVRAKEVSGGGVGGVVGGMVKDVARAPQAAALRKTAAFNLVDAATAPREAMLEASLQRGEADSTHWKKIGDRGFRFASGYWIDEQCSKSSDRAIVETSEAAPDFEEIVKRYPELRAMRPVIILWKDKIFVLR